MASSGGNTVLAVGIGAGGGLLLWYLLSGRQRRDASTPPVTTSAPSSGPVSAAPASTAATVAPPTSTPAATPAAPAPSSSGACALRLDSSGLTADGTRIDIPGAVARCKASGRAELTFASDGPARIYVDLNRALAGAGVAVTVKRP